MMLLALLALLAAVADTEATLVNGTTDGVQAAVMPCVHAHACRTYLLSACPVFRRLSIAFMAIAADNSNVLLVRPRLICVGVQQVPKC